MQSSGVSKHVDVNCSHSHKVTGWEPCSQAGSQGRLLWVLGCQGVAGWLLRGSWFRKGSLVYLLKLSGCYQWDLSPKHIRKVLYMFLFLLGLSVLFYFPYSLFG